METLKQNSRGNSVEIELGETSFRLRSVIDKQMADRRINYGQVPFDFHDEAMVKGPAWLSWIGLILGGAWALIAALELSGVTPIEDTVGDRIAMLTVGTLIAVAGGARLVWLRRRGGKFKVFANDHFQFALLDDDDFPAIHKALSERRDAELRRDLFKVEPELGEEENRSRLSWLVDRGVITREEYETAMAEVEAACADRQVGF
ncbi:hypothetical protein HK107_14090 [Parvularcula sp. ZS-1/3]|uniref:SHOCT domain-containing protein n=1 Tax=Parvularcula mediterranea TaxID=2732508 RepID=A0A7Y3RNP2_9PROT|nr:hypothetical protein [Parvularcula mediterranea]NNU17459.1 hypothetical protein [Parvularcula mediterranea]